MPRLRAILAAFSLMLFAVVLAHAQGVTSVQVGQGKGAGTGNGNGTGIGAIAGMIGGFGSSSMNGVPGQPFSADVIDETDHFLADGNHIHRENHGRMFRDSQGRTRNETEFAAFGPESKPTVHIVISDPVEGRFILLNPEQKTATVNQFGKAISAASGLGLPAQPANNATKPAAPAPAAADPGAIRITSGMQALDNMKSARKDLGTREIEGYTVTGARYTYTIPAGAIGNDQPMTTTTELWFSTDLKMDLVNKHESPESGTHVHKLVNIRMGDPDPLLFQVPADYTVKEAQQP